MMVVEYLDVSLFTINSNESFKLHGIQPSVENKVRSNILTYVSPQDFRLQQIAREVVWWELPEITLADQNFFLGRVMARGFWNDVVHVQNVYGEDALREALRHSKPGEIDIASWHYWHRRLGLEPVPELPKRRFE
jgi:hypothetical protein